MSGIPLTSLISVISDYVPFLVGLFFYRSLNIDMRVLLIFLSAGVVSTSVGLYLAIQVKNNLLLFHIWTLTEYTFLIFIFSFWQKSYRFKKALRWSIPLFMFLWLVAKISQIEQFDQIHNATRSIGSIILMSVSIYTLYQLNEVSNTLYKDYRFWVCLGVLFYYPSSIALFSLSDLRLVSQTWHVHAMMNVAANLSYVGSFLCLHPRFNVGGSR